MCGAREHKTTASDVQELLLRRPPVQPAIERGEMSVVSGERPGSALIFVSGPAEDKDRALCGPGSAG